MCGNCKIVCEYFENSFPISETYGKNKHNLEREEETKRHVGRKKDSSDDKTGFFRKKREKNALRIGRYFRSDYIGKELLKNFFLASIGYILVLAVAVLYHIEWLVDEIDTIDLQFAAGCLIASYLCFLAVYSIAVYVISTIRYQGAQKKLKWYGKELDDLQNMYEEQEKSGKKSGRRRKET